MKTSHEIEFSHVDKVLFPVKGYTKGDLLDYYGKITPEILPHLKDRMLMMHRFPDGIGSDGFYQKNVSEYFPSWIHRKEVDKENGKVTHVLCNDKDTLLYLVNQGTIELHTWLSLASSVYNPDKLIIDLDPSGNDFEQVRKAALSLHDMLEQFSVMSYPMTTGSRGMHVIIRLDSKNDFEISRDAGRALGKLMVHKYPGLFTLEARKHKRGGKLYFDIQRNAYAQTGIVPYSLRARQGAPVAAPLDWNEVSDAGLSSDTYHLGNIFRRLSQKNDLWTEYGRTKYSAHTLLGKFRDAMD